MGFFEKLKSGLEKTKKAIQYEYSNKKLTEEFYFELEEQLIMADAGVDTTLEIIEQLKYNATQKKILDQAEAVDELISICSGLLSADKPLDLSGAPAVILMIGVNGAGKTTTSGKLAAYFRRSGKSVVLAAADTFRAAAEDQLEVWAKRSDTELIRGANDPSAVIYDAVSSAKQKGTDIVICDTAGRLHTKKNLMDELAKMHRTIKKASPNASVETFLVLDAVTGQNAISQAAQFTDSASVTGIVLTKLDGTAKGGAVLSIKRTLDIPVRYIGVGEGIDDLSDFVPTDFSKALFS